MKCDKLQRYSVRGEMYNGEEICGGFAYYDADEVDAFLAEKDKEIAELKAALERDFIAKKSAEKVLRDLLDCGLIKEWFYNGTFHALLKADDPHLEIAELKKKLEDVQASHYAESVDAGMRERRLRRALWLARAELCRRLDVDRYLRKHLNSWYNENLLTFNDACVAMEVKMCDAESKCRAKAEEYK